MSSSVLGGARSHSAPLKERLIELITTQKARLGIIGLGYVGLPLALEFAKRGFQTTGFEVDADKVAALNSGRSYLPHFEDPTIGNGGTLRATTNFDELQDCDCIIICVPTPLTNTNEPDLTYILSAMNKVVTGLRHGQLVVLESTTYPGTTDEVLLAAFRKTGLELDKDFFLAFSPERIDPGNLQFGVADIPKIVGGCSADSTETAQSLYSQIIVSVHPVSSTRVAETAKLLENIFRAVNIGLINELVQICNKLQIDIWEVIEAAKTKPFGYMPFYPGPGLGGHCIPLDPLYLAWRGKQYGLESRFINLANEINSAMPTHVVSLVADALGDRYRAIKEARVLLIGVAYKRNVNDARESPAYDVVRLLREKKADVRYHDPYIPRLEFDHSHISRLRKSSFFGFERRRLQPPNGAGGDRRARNRHSRRADDPLESVPLADNILRSSDCVVILTDHSVIDYERVVQLAPLIVDTRNAINPQLRRMAKGKIVRL